MLGVSQGISSEAKGIKLWFIDIVACFQLTLHIQGDE